MSKAETMAAERPSFLKPGLVPEQDEPVVAEVLSEGCVVPLEIVMIIFSYCHDSRESGWKKVRAFGSLRLVCSAWNTLAMDASLPFYPFLLAMRKQEAALQQGFFALQKNDDACLQEPMRVGLMDRYYFFRSNAAGGQVCGYDRKTMSQITMADISDCHEVVWWSAMDVLVCLYQDCKVLMINCATSSVVGEFEFVGKVKSVRISSGNVYLLWIDNKASHLMCWQSQLDIKEPKEIWMGPRVIRAPLQELRGHVLLSGHHKFRCNRGWALVEGATGTVVAQQVENLRESSQCQVIALLYSDTNPRIGIVERNTNKRTSKATHVMTVISIQDDGKGMKAVELKKENISFLSRQVVQIFPWKGLLVVMTRNKAAKLAHIHLLNRELQILKHKVQWKGIKAKRLARWPDGKLVICCTDKPNRKHLLDLEPEEQERTNNSQPSCPSSSEATNRTKRVQVIKASW